MPYLCSGPESRGGDGAYALLLSLPCRYFHPPWKGSLASALYCIAGLFYDVAVTVLFRFRVS